MAATQQQDILMLSKRAFDETRSDPASSQIALKSVANALLLQEDSRQLFADAGYAAQTADSLRAWNEDFVQELICSRILFLLTYKTTFDLSSLFMTHHLIDSIFAVRCLPLLFGISQSEQILDFHAREHPTRHGDRVPEKGHTESTDIRALSETLKLVFNLIQFYPQHANAFRPLLQPVLALLEAFEPEMDPLRAPLNYIINVLLNIDLESPGAETRRQAVRGTEQSVFPEDKPCLFVGHLLRTLEQAINFYTEDMLESKAVPLLTLMRRLVEIAPETVKIFLSNSLLPSDTERDRPLGSSDSLASKLLKLSTTPSAPQVREGVSSLLFELSGKDPASFIRNVGYGYASGYLMSHKIAIPANALEGGDVGAKVTSVDGREINPITGQRRDKEPPDPAQNMSDEEKEREAERLFVLFERLKSTGVVSVMNPVEVAAREGKLQEVYSSDSD